MRKVLFLIVVLFMTISLNAQVGVNVGPKIGYQASKLSFQKGDMKTAFVNDLNVGLFTRFTFEKFTLQPELLLSCQNINKKVNNLSLPVLFGIKIVDNKNFKMRANVGPVAYFTVGKMASHAKPVNLGAALGLGLDVWRFTFDINYSFGLTKVYRELLGVANNARQNVFVLTMGFKLTY